MTFQLLRSPVVFASFVCVFLLTTSRSTKAAEFNVHGLDGYPDSLIAWNCQHLGSWLQQQNWHWQEMPEYTQQLCLIGVTGSIVGSLDDHDLKEVGVKSSIRRKILLKAFTALKQQLSNAGYLLGKHSPSVVAKVSFTLCSPRLGILASHVLQWNQDALHMPAPASLKSLQVEESRSTAAPVKVPGAAAAFARLRLRARELLHSYLSGVWWTLKCASAAAKWVLLPGLLAQREVAAIAPGYPMFDMFVSTLAWIHPLLDAFLVACMLRPVPRLRVRMLALVACLLGVPAACGGQLALAYLVDPLLPPWLRLVTTLHCCVMLPLTVGMVYIMIWSPERLHELHQLADMMQQEFAQARAGRGRPRAVGNNLVRQHVPVAQVRLQFAAFRRPAPQAGEPAAVAAHANANAAAAAAAANAAALGNRHRDRPGVHWPPPLEIPAELEDATDMPDGFRCPISFSVMREPTQSSAGTTYDRWAILRWLEDHRTDPVTHLPLRRRHLSPNLALRQLIETWVHEKQQEQRQRQEQAAAAAAITASALAHLNAATRGAGSPSTPTTQALLAPAAPPAAPAQPPTNPGARPAQPHPLDRAPLPAARTASVLTAATALLQAAAPRPFENALPDEVARAGALRELMRQRPRSRHASPMRASSSATAAASTAAPDRSSTAAGAPLAQVLQLHAAPVQHAPGDEPVVGSWELGGAEPRLAADAALLVPLPLPQAQARQEGGALDDREAAAEYRELLLRGDAEGHAGGRAGLLSGAETPEVDEGVEWSGDDEDDAGVGDGAEARGADGAHPLPSPRPSPRALSGLAHPSSSSRSYKLAPAAATPAAGASLPSPSAASPQHAPSPHPLSPPPAISSSTDAPAAHPLPAQSPLPAFSAPFCRAEQLMPPTTPTTPTAPPTDDDSGTSQAEGTAEAPAATDSGSDHDLHCSSQSVHCSSSEGSSVRMPDPSAGTCQIHPLTPVAAAAAAAAVGCCGPECPLVSRFMGCCFVCQEHGRVFASKACLDPCMTGLLLDGGASSKGGERAGGAEALDTGEGGAGRASGGEGGAAGLQGWGPAWAMEEDGSASDPEVHGSRGSNTDSADAHGSHSDDAGEHGGS